MKRLALHIVCQNFIQTQYQYLTNCYARSFEGDNKIKTQYLLTSNITYSYKKNYSMFLNKNKKYRQSNNFYAIKVYRPILITFSTCIFSRSLYQWYDL